MKVILLKDVKGVGQKFQEKEVSPGYAANFLLPKKLAIAVTDAAAGQVKALKENDLMHKEGEQQALAKALDQLSGLIVKTEAKANDKNHLFAALSKEKISSLLKKQNINIPAEHIDLENPIKETGTYAVPVRMGDKKAEFTLEVGRA